ncbi:MAG: hypothetical protein K6T83_06915 [Alicyclobacillus sp.]|nr:hypothetical protein [Alicyclobacillus sp.]
MPRVAVGTDEANTCPLTVMVVDDDTATAVDVAATDVADARAHRDVAAVAIVAAFAHGELMIPSPPMAIVDNAVRQIMPVFFIRSTFFD